MKSLASTLLFLTALISPSLAQNYGSTPSSTSSSSSSTHTTTTAASSSSSKPTAIINVGQGGFVFSPDSVTAAAGSILEFHFAPGNLHSVAQSSFAGPCKPLSASSLFSGFPGPNDVFQVTVNNTDPIWLYCAQVSHCQGGMAMVVNPPSSGADTLAAYKSAAQGTGSSSAPANVQGGVIESVSQLASSSSSSSGSGGSTSSSSSTAAATSKTVSNGAMAVVVRPVKAVALAVGVAVLAWLMD